jgi:hypothetical protein
MKDNFDVHKWNLERYLKQYLSEQEVKESTKDKEATPQPKGSKD